MNPTSTFSVVLPYYNGSKYVRAAVESVLAQTYTNFELLLIDDGSPDAVEATALESLAASLNDPRVRYFRKPNGGLSDARNFGIDHSDGEYIAFIDQDDLWHPEKLQCQRDVFANDAGVFFICSEAALLGGRGGSLRIGPKWGFQEGLVPNTFGKLLRGSFVACSTVAFRRTAVATVGYSNRAFTVVPDYEYFIRFAEAGDFYFIAKPLATYRLHGANTSRQIVRRECECLTLLFGKRPRSFADRCNLAYGVARSLGVLSWKWVARLASST